MINILHVPDIHLYDQEIGNSTNYPEESIKILNIIKDVFINGNYDFITLGGDIQHAKIQKTMYISTFQKLLKEIGMLCKERLIERGLLDKIKAYDKNGNLINIYDKPSVLFSVRGQHDTNSIEGFTFFDLLIDNNIIVNPRYIILDDLQINFLNNCKDTVDLFEDKKDGIRLVIGLYHNLILEEGVYIDGFIGKTLSPKKLGLFKDVDLAVINDIHTPIKPYTVVTDNKVTKVFTPGSLGRTSFSKGQDRDYANLVSITVAESVDANYVPFDLTPSEIFFNKDIVLKNKLVENAFKDFSLSIEDLEISYFDIYNELDKLNLDPDIKEICIEILKEVE